MRRTIPWLRYLEVPGAQTTLPVNSAKSPFSYEFAKDARERFENRSTTSWAAITRSTTTCI